MWAFSSQFRVILSYFRAIFEPYLSRFWVVFVLFSSRLLSDKNGLERCGIWKSISKCIFGEIVLFKMLRWQWCQKASDFWNAKYWSTISEIGHQHNQSSTSVSNIDATRWFSRKNWNQHFFQSQNSWFSDRPSNWNLADYNFVQKLHFYSWSSEFLIVSNIFNNLQRSVRETRITGSHILPSVDLNL